MANNQVGGMQEVLLRVKWKSMRGFERAVKAVEGQGGRLLYAYPPAVMVASVPPANIDKLVGKGGIISASTEPVGMDQVSAAVPGPGFVFAAWNDHLNVARRMQMMAAPEAGINWDDPNHQNPDPPEELLEELRARERRAGMGFGAPLAEGASNPSIPVLTGRVAVGLVLVDSTVPAYALTDKEKVKLVSETIEGLNMLSGFEPRAGIQWFYDFPRPKIKLPENLFSGEPVFEWEDIWRNEAMRAMGYAPNLNGMNDYIEQIRAKNGAQWAYAIFVTKYPSAWFAYMWSNHIYMHTGVDGWGINNFHLVVAHESCHIFGVTDEYSESGCSCSQRGGRYQVLNGNCERCASSFVPCLMAHNTPALCDFTRGQLGWNELAVMSKGSGALQGNYTFDFERGLDAPPTGADVYWQQVDDCVRLLVPQCGAMLAHLGKPDFDAVSRQALETQPYTAAPIDGSDNASNTLTPGSVIAIKTNTGRYAKMKVKTYGKDLGVEWVCYM